jgi:uncharacterized protein YndB with AHSA1/START domain
LPPARRALTFQPFDPPVGLARPRRSDPEPTPPTMADAEIKPSVSDAAVTAATGHGWAEWFSLLDAAGAATMDHRGIVAHLGANHEIDAWWRQSVAVAYEQARGLRDRHQTPAGYQVSGSKTVGVPVERLFDAWHDESLRAQWLPGEAITIRRATRPKSLRITWSDGRSHVEANLYARGEAKSQVGVGHTKLQDADEAARMKAYWAEALGRLKTLLEG